jgi:uncharacterized membrane protein
MVSKLKPILITMVVSLIAVALATRVKFVRDLVYGAPASTGA